MKTKIIFIGNSKLLRDCINYALKFSVEVFVISKDVEIKNKLKKKTKFIKFEQLHKVKADYLFSVLNEKIISSKQLGSIKKFSINFHDGPLPKYAGLFSSSWAIYYKEKNHGVCWHKMDKELDTGEIILEKKFNINCKDTSYSIDAKGIRVGFDLFKILIKKILKEKINFKKQNLKARTYFGKKELHKLIKEYLKNKKNKILARSFSLSAQKYKLIEKMFKVNLQKNYVNKNSVKKNDINISNTKKILKIFKNNFNLKFSSLNNKKFIKQLKLNHYPKWDSLAHAKLLGSIEKSFKIKIDENNISNFSSFEGTLSYINKI